MESSVQWNFVASNENPADDCSRALPASVLRRRLAYIIRWISTPDSRKNLAVPQTYPPTKFSTLRAFVLVRLEKLYRFDDLANQRQMSPGSPLVSLNPIIDRRRLLRVGGRVGNAPLPSDVLHPIILPSEARITEMITFDLRRLVDPLKESFTSTESAFSRSAENGIAPNRISRSTMYSCHHLPGHSTRWPLGRIIEIFPGPKQVRRNHGPTVKLCFGNISRNGCIRLSSAGRRSAKVIRFRRKQELSSGSEEQGLVPPHREQAILGDL